MVFTWAFCGSFWEEGSGCREGSNIKAQMKITQVRFLADATTDSQSYFINKCFQNDLKFSLNYLYTLLIINIYYDVKSRSLGMNIHININNSNNL